MWNVNSKYNNISNRKRKIIIATNDGYDNYTGGRRSRRPNHKSVGD